jgi:hypothetical protein
MLVTPTIDELERMLRFSSVEVQGTAYDLVVSQQDNLNEQQQVKIIFGSFYFPENVPSRIYTLVFRKT